MLELVNSLFLLGSTVERKIFEPEHDMFRATARRFFETECAPHAAVWMCSLKNRLISAPREQMR